MFKGLIPMLVLASVIQQYSSYEASTDIVPGNKTDALISDIEQPSGRRRITISPTYVHYTYTCYSQRHYSNRQCPVIKVIRRHEMAYDDKCKWLCNDIPECTAYNEDHEDGCELRNCGIPQPYPIGMSVSFNTFKWWGCSRTEAKFGFTRYHGPYGKYFSWTQCGLIEKKEHMSYVECEDLCDKTANCTAFNFDLGASKACELRSCGTPQPKPDGDRPRWRDWEGWSKDPIEKDELKRPWPRCPSIQCEQFDFPSKLKMMSAVDKREYCDCKNAGIRDFCDYKPSCGCFWDPYCYYRCEKCPSKTLDQGTSRSHNLYNNTLIG